MVGDYFNERKTVGYHVKSSDFRSKRRGVPSIAEQPEAATAQVVGVGPHDKTRK